MSIYTITLKRELLNEERELVAGPNRQASSTSTLAPAQQRRLAKHRLEANDDDDDVEGANKIGAGNRDKDFERVERGGGGATAQEQASNETADDSRHYGKALSPVNGQEEAEEADWLDCLCNRLTIGKYRAGWASCVLARLDLGFWQIDAFHLSCLRASS